MNGAVIDDFYLTKGSSPIVSVSNAKLFETTWYKQPHVYIHVTVSSILPYNVDCTCNITHSDGTTESVSLTTINGTRRSYNYTYIYS